MAPLLHRAAIKSDQSNARKWHNAFSSGDCDGSEKSQLGVADVQSDNLLPFRIHVAVFSTHRPLCLTPMMLCLNSLVSWTRFLYTLSGIGCQIQQFSGLGPDRLLARDHARRILVFPAAAAKYLAIVGALIVL